MPFLADPRLSITLSVVAGVLSHWLFFIRGEHHLYVTSYIGVAAAAFVAAFEFHSFTLPPQQAFTETCGIATTYVAALCISITVYRTFFHPLRHFPGPRSMRFSKFGHAFLSRKLDNHHQMDRLHRKYGDIVRTGPNELTLFSAEAYVALHGAQSHCTKSDWYDVLKPSQSFHSTRVKSIHGRRKLVWERAFSSKAISGYEPRVFSHVATLEQRLARTQGFPVNMTDMVVHFVGDVIGDVVSGLKFNMVQSGKKHFAADLLSGNFKPVGFINPVPWLIVFLMAIPGALSPWLRVVDWSKREIAKRLETTPEHSDILGYLVEANKKIYKTEQGLPALADDTILAVLAGSGTITPVLTYLIYHLALSSSDVAKIRDELKMVEDIRSDQNLRKLPHLNAFINETLRVHPPILDGLPRNTPAGGIVVSDKHIPGNVTCLAPFCTISKLESCFEQPEAFIPERWTTAPHLVKNKIGHSPFSIGPMSCVGKHLAWMILRIVTASLVSKFDIEFNKGEKESTILDESYNTVTNNPGPLRLVFKEREIAL